MDKEEILFEVKNEEYKSEVAVIFALQDYVEDIDLVAALNSIKNQTLKKVDIIVIIDGSNEQSIPLVYSWLIDNRCSFNSLLLLKAGIIEQPIKIKSIPIKYITAPYIFMLDSNAILYPRCLDSLLRGIKNSKASFTHCYIEIFGVHKGIFNAYPWNEQTLQLSNAADALILAKKCTLEQVLCSLERKNELMGYELWKEIIADGGTRILIPEILIRYKVKFDSLYKPIVSPHV